MLPCLKIRRLLLFFNEQLTEFIADHVVSLFKSSIDAEFLGKYEVAADGGSIAITKVG